jgi:ABC-type multidrug transport system fused ATPase/permease subunit
MNQNPIVFLFKKLWRFSDSNRKYIILFMAMSFVAQGINLLNPLLLGLLVGEIQKYGVNPATLPYLYGILTAFVVKEVLFWVFHGPSRMIERVVAFSAAISYRRYLLNGILNLKLDWHTDHDSGDTIDKVAKAGDGFLQFSENIFQIIHVVVRVLGTAAILLWFSPWIGLSVLICILAAFRVVLLFDQRLIPQYQRLAELANKASASVFDALSNITTVKILSIERPIHNGIMTRFEASRALQKLNAYLNEWKWCTGILLFQLIAVVPIGFYLHNQGASVDAGRVSTLFLYLLELFYAFFTFGSQYELITQWKTRMLNAEPIEQAFVGNTHIVRHHVGLWKNLKIKDLVFQYDDQQKLPHINQLSIDIKRNERIAIIGESGSGKTTFLKVLHGLYPNAKGLLQIDSLKSNQTSLGSLDLKTMLVPQEPEVFSSTIRDNITLGLPYDDQTILDFAKLAAFDKIIAKLPKGLDSITNEKGVNLSGGEKQRLALTRALLFAAEKDIILLDESTSSVDPKNERIIYENLLKHFQNKTIIASIHKKHLLPLFDRVLEFKEGCLHRYQSVERLV